jgi:hypothetical protein
MSGSGRGGNNRRGFRRRDHDRDNRPKDNSGNSIGANKKKADNLKFDKNRGVLVDRPKWTPPQVSTEPIPVPDCPYCGKPIKDIASAIADKDSGQAVHFDCIIGRLAENETLERGDSIAYIGGGRFGVVHFNASQEGYSQGGRRAGESGGEPRPWRASAEGSGHGFTIKKIFEWENKDERADWRRLLADRFSVT